MKTCHVCQMVDKPNQNVKPAPLKPVPSFDEPFGRVLIWLRCPYAKDKFWEQLLVDNHCVIPFRTISSPGHYQGFTKFFTQFGMPKEIQSDQGSDFTSGIFQQVIYQLGIKHVMTSACHIQSQGVGRISSDLENQDQSVLPWQSGRLRWRNPLVVCY